MSAVSESVNRKPTRPSIITPNNRPAVYQVSPKGHRKIPDAGVKPQPVNSLEELVTNLGISAEPTSDDNSSLDMDSKQLLADDLKMSDDDDSIIATVSQSASRPKSSNLISALRGPGVCGYRFIKGSRKGELCLKRCNKSLTLCGVHRVSLKPNKSKPSRLESTPNSASPTTDRNKTSNMATKKPIPLTSSTIEPTDRNKTSNLATEKPIPSTSSTIEHVKLTELEETKAKLDRLEKVVLSLLKNRPQEDTPTETSTRKTIREKKLKRKHSTLSTRSIQKIRIYKLKHGETYKLLRYKDGMPVFESKNKLYMVPLPKSMSRPIPNRRWSLIGGPDKKMIWKEV